MTNTKHKRLSISLRKKWKKAAATTATHTHTNSSANWNKCKITENNLSEGNNVEKKKKIGMSYGVRDNSTTQIKCVLICDIRYRNGFCKQVKCEKQRPNIATIRIQYNKRIDCAKHKNKRATYNDSDSSSSHSKSSKNVTLTKSRTYTHKHAHKNHLHSNEEFRCMCIGLA